MAGKKRWEGFIGHGTALSVLRGKIRSDKHPDEWAEYIATVAWLHPDVTRGSVNMNDWVRNPNDRSDKRQYRVHWLETKMSEAVGKICALTSAAFPPEYQYADGIRRDFKVCSRVISELKHFSVKPPRRETSLCRYHYEWTLLHAAMYQYRLKLKPVSCEHVRARLPPPPPRAACCHPTAVFVSVWRRKSRRTLMLSELHWSVGQRRRAPTQKAPTTTMSWI